MKRMRSLLVCSTLGVLGAIAFAAAPIPRPAPQLEIVDSAGKHLLAGYKGKVVVVQFLLTTCQHCQAYSQLLNKIQAEYGPRGFQALGAAHEATPETARDYGAQFAPGFPVGPLAREPLLSFMGLSVVDRFGFPQIAVIDRKGQVREQTSSDMNERQPLQDEAHLRAVIEKLLAEGVGKRAASASGL
jgi:thiol-disulfide isomerase/thioredoxin